MQIKQTPVLGQLLMSYVVHLIVVFITLQQNTHF